MVSKSDDVFWLDDSDLSVQVRCALLNFVWQWFTVFWGSALQDVADEHVFS